MKPPIPISPTCLTNPIPQSPTLALVRSSLNLFFIPPASIRILTPAYILQFMLYWAARQQDMKTQMRFHRIGLLRTLIPLHMNL